MSEFERIRKHGRGQSAAPRLSIYASGRCRFNAVAAEQFLDGVAAVGFFVDEEGARLGVSLGDASDNGYSLTHYDDGAGASIRSVLNALEIDRENIERAVQLPLDHDPSEGLLIADLDPLFEVVADA